jgi:hypothetical protein
MRNLYEIIASFFCYQKQEAGTNITQAPSPNKEGERGESIGTRKCRHLTGKHIYEWTFSHGHIFAFQMGKIMNEYCLGPLLKVIY